MNISHALKALDYFKVDGVPVKCSLYGNGHINRTFIVDCKNRRGETTQYILQAVNQNAFKNPEQVMSNISKVTAHLRKMDQNERHVMTLIPTLDGEFFYRDNLQNFWRIYTFIDRSLCLERPESVEDFRQCAVAFGHFRKDLADFPADELFETIPDFHNTPKRFETFLKSVSTDAKNRAASVSDEIRFVKDRADFYDVLFRANREGRLPLCVTHNDTKSNNVLLDEKTRTALCVIDLDTIMPGFSVNDFGDSIRFGASTAAEDEQDLSKVHFDINLFEAYLDGYIEGCGGLLSNDEIMLMPEGAKMMTVECGMRFLTDYLDGDTYFRTAYSDHNLVRCRTQFKLVEEMEQQWDAMKAIAKKYCK